MSYIWRTENMEKMRRIFPGLFVLVLALLIVLLFALPAQADSANHTFHGKLYLYTAVLDP